MELTTIRNITFENPFYDTKSENILLNFEAELIYDNDRLRRFGKRLVYSGLNNAWSLWFITNSLHKGEADFLRGEAVQQDILNALMGSDEFKAIEKKVMRKIEKHLLPKGNHEVELREINRNDNNEIHVSFVVGKRKGFTLFKYEDILQEWKPFVTDVGMSPYLGYTNSITHIVSQKMQLFLLFQEK